MQKVNYVLASWSGPRACPSNPPYLFKHIQQLNQLQHNLSQVTIGNPYNPKISHADALYIKNLRYLKKGTPIVVEDMDNYGGSYGQYSRIFDKYQDQFQYWIFIEDDYVPFINNFDNIMIKMFEKKNCGFLCQCAKAYFGFPVHAAISNGISNNESLKKIGKLPYDKSPIMGQVKFSRAFIHHKLGLADMCGEFKAPFWRNKIEEHCPEGKEYIIVPIQMVPLPINNKPIKMI